MNLHTAAANKLAGALALLVLGALGWVLGVGPQTTGLAEAREEVTRTQDQNAALGRQLATLTEQAAHLDDTRATAEALSDKVPATADQPGFFRAVSAAAEDAGIGPEDLTALSPTPPDLGGLDPVTGVPLLGTESGLARQTVSITAEADYDETLLLLGNLEQMPRAFLTTTLEVSGAEGTYVTTITGTLLVMPAVADPGASVAATSPAATR